VALLDQPAQQSEKERLHRRIIGHYEKLVAAVPTESFFLYRQGTYEILLARLLRLMNRPEEAETHFRTGLALRFKLATENPANASYQQSVVRDCVELKDWLALEKRFQEAGAVLRQLVQRLPANPSACNNMAWFLVTCADAAQHDPVAALGFAKLANQATPADANIWNTLGVVHYRLGQYQEAARALDESMRLGQGGIPLDWLFRAMTHLRLDEKPKALALYDRAIARMAEIKSADPELLRFRAEAAALLGNRK
jgi:tetratricopeptide (TPR) repeat protein